MGNPDYIPDHSPRLKPKSKLGKLFLLFVLIAVIALPFVIFQAFSIKPADAIAKINNAPVSDFDHNAKQLFGTYNGTTPSYMEGS